MEPPDNLPARQGGGGEGEGEDPNLSSASPSPPPLVVSLLGVEGDAHASYFHASDPHVFHAFDVKGLPDTFKEGKLYSLRARSHLDALFSELPSGLRRIYTCRRDLTLIGAHYDLFVLRPLLLQRRIEDYSRSSATIVELCPLILTMPVNNRFLSEERFRAETGEYIDVLVETVHRRRTKMELQCRPRGPLPATLEKGDRLECFIEDASIETKSLELIVKGHRPIGNRPVLDRLYGEKGSFFWPRPDSTPVKIDTAYGEISLNGELINAVRRYQCHSETCPAFVIETCEESEEVVPMLPATFAMSHQEKGGLQVFLSPSNAAAFALADRLEYFNVGEKKKKKRIIHVARAEVEACLGPLDRSPYSPFTSKDSVNPDIISFNKFRDKYLKMGKWRRRALLPNLRRLFEAAWNQENLEDVDILILTVDLALSILLKPKDPEHPCNLQKLLEQKRIDRVVVNDVQALSEAGLNGIVLNFTNHPQEPPPMFVFIGDPNVCPEFKRYKSAIASELEVCSALEVLKRRSNFPVIRLREEFTWPSLDDEPASPPESPDSRRLLTGIGRGVISIDELSHSGLFGTCSGDEDDVSPLEVVVRALEECGQLSSSGTLICDEDRLKRIVESGQLMHYEVFFCDKQDRSPSFVVLIWIDNCLGEMAMMTPVHAYSDSYEVAVKRYKEFVPPERHMRMAKKKSTRQKLSVVTYGRPETGTTSDRRDSTQGQKEEASRG